MPMFREWCCGNKEKRLCFDKALKCWSYLIILCGHTFSAPAGRELSLREVYHESLQMEIANLIRERWPADDHTFLTSSFAVSDSLAHFTPYWNTRTQAHAR